MNEARPSVAVIGSGVAGLTAALHLREQGLHVTAVTKVNIDDGSTRWAQGDRAVRCYLWLDGSALMSSLKGKGTAGLPVQYK